MLCFSLQTLQSQPCLKLTVCVLLHSIKLVWFLSGMKALQANPGTSISTNEYLNIFCTFLSFSLP